MYVGRCVVFFRSLGETNRVDDEEVGVAARRLRRVDASFDVHIDLAFGPDVLLYCSSSCSLHWTGTESDSRFRFNEGLCPLHSHVQCIVQERAC